MNDYLSTFSKIVKMSRPRFWLYLAGPFLVGYAFGMKSTTDLFRNDFLYSLFFFMIPMNLIVYGVNDLYDLDTDLLNPKKEDKEIRIVKSNRNLYRNIIALSLVLSIPLFTFFNTLQIILLLVYLFLAISYSARPLRLKTRPLLDSLSNVFYAMPGYISYSYLTGELPNLEIILSASAWAISMHLFSAIPDIEPDSKAGLETTAVLLGKRFSLLTCAGLWLIAWFLVYWINPVFILFIVYPMIPFVLIFLKNVEIDDVYWKFPYINTLYGFLLFVVAIARLM